MERKGGFTIDEVIVTNQYGIHARPSAQIVNKCREYDGNVFLNRIEPPQEDPSKEYNGGKIIEIGNMDAGKDSRLRIRVEGEDEKAKEFCEELKDLISSFDF